MRFPLRAGLVSCSLLAAIPGTLFAAANFVYHERTNNNTGGICGPYVTTLTPTSSQAYALQFKIEFQSFTDRARVYYTTDGTTPSGAFGVPSGTTQVLTAAYSCTFVDLSQGGQVVDVASATIPAQPAGTTVKYVVSAWRAAAGPEIFGNSGTCATCTACTTSVCANLFQYSVPPDPTPTPTVPIPTNTPTPPPPTPTRTRTPAARFHTLTPCRVVDTRGPAGPYGAPSLAAGADRTFVFAGQCAIPSTATAVALNVVAINPSTGPGFLTLFPGGTARPLAATINYNAGHIRANNAIIPLGVLHDITVHCGQGSGTVDMVVDVNGYFQ